MKQNIKPINVMTNREILNKILEIKNEDLTSIGHNTGSGIVIFE